MKMKTIRKYKNRKLYDVQESCYVNFSELSEIIKAGETIQVVTVPNGDDVTETVLLSVIADNEKRIAKSKAGQTNVEFLTEVIRSQTGTLSGYFQELKNK